MGGAFDGPPNNEGEVILNNQSPTFANYTPDDLVVYNRSASLNPSDYYLHFNWNNTNGNNQLNCNENNAYWIVRTKGITSNNWFEKYATSTAPSWDLDNPLSPFGEYNENWNSTSLWNEQSNHFYYAVGPNSSLKVQLIYNEWDLTCSKMNFLNGTINEFDGEPIITTDPLYGPQSVTDTSTSYTSIDVEWEKGTHVPDDAHGYRIYRQVYIDGAWSNLENIYEQESTGHHSLGNELSLFLDGTSNSDFDFNWMTFKDPTALPGLLYRYNIHTIYSENNGSSYVESSEFVSIELEKEDLPLATNVNVDNKHNNDCNQIRLTWDAINSNFYGNFYSDIEYTVASSLGDELTTTSNTEYIHDISSLDFGEEITYFIYTRAYNTLLARWETSVNTQSIDANRVALPTQITSYTVNYDDDLEANVLQWANLSADESVETFDVYRGTDLIANDINISSESNYQVYTDATNLENCATYTYQVISKSCNQQTSSNPVSVTVSAGLSNTFTPDENLTVSKGYFPDKVNLSWSNNNNEIIDKFSIYRKVFESNENNYIKLDEVSSSQHMYVDEYAEAGKLYEYQIEAETPCGENVAYLLSEPVVGYRLPEGSVSGHIEYEGGNNVENAKILVESTNDVTNKSISFSGATGSHVDLSNAINDLVDSDDTTHAFSFSTWVKPEAQSSHNTLFMIASSGNQTKFAFRYKSNQFRIYNDYISVSGEETLDNWSHVALTFNPDTDSMKFYLNGSLYFARGQISNLELNSSSQLILGKMFNSGGGSYYQFKGEMDEVRLWNREITAEEVLNTYNRYISKDHPGLVAMYHCDEGLGTNIYDISKDDYDFNRNDGVINGNISFVDDAPLSSQIGNYAYTDENGNYFVDGVRYTESGNSFVITPTTGLPYYSTPHEFEPNQRVVYIGDGSEVVDGQNFTDISAFTVTGSVYYHDLHDKDEDGNIEESGDCPVKDAMILIDGEPVIKNGEVIMTDSQGQFEIEVPIGEHRISVEKQGHTFSSGFYPSEEGFENFQEDKSGLLFVDNTIIEVKGRVVGGLIEGEKEVGMGLSVNNIGQASFNFDSQNGLDALAISTDSTTGEYQAQLLPIKYTISDFGVASNLSIAQYGDFQAFDVLDLSVILQLTTVYDTTYAADQTISEIDSASYHYDESFIYRSTPSIRVLNSEKTDLFTAEQSIEIDEDTSFESLEELGHPIFKQNRPYEAYIKVEEEYKNYDSDPSNPVVDRIPVKNGQLTIVNNLSTDPSEQTWLLDSEDGDTLYSFSAGLPNLQTDDNPDYSFTKTWDITFETGPHSVSWQPEGEVYRGIVFGAKPEGTNFITEGPQVVSHILRDPPGSASFSFYEEGSTLSQSTEISTSIGASYGWDTEVSLGPKFTVGLGYETEVEIAASASNELEVSASIGHDGEYVETTTFTSRFSTNAGDEYEGMWMDVYMGRSMNMNFGISTNLTLIDTAKCNVGLSAVECVGDEINGYRIGRQKGFFAFPGGYGTQFYYTQHEIVMALIPELEYLRNDLLLTDGRYTSVSEENYGTNNDDEVWESEIVVNELKTLENNGPSYTFVSSADTAEVDSVRWYNQQIRLWKEAIKRNEELKLQASPVTNGSSNISFDGGVGDVTYTYENTNSDANAITWESAISNEWSSEVGGTAGGVGLTLGTSMEISLEHSGSHTWSEENTTTVGFTLSDGDLDDKYSIDILDDGTSTNGKVFRVQGGRTSCPYFDGEQTLYHEPGTDLSAATIQMEQPTISVSPSSLSNVPEDEMAVFNLSLGNDNPLGYIQEYTLQVVEQHNPNGAILRIDGWDANREYLVPAGTSINKVLTVEKGPEALDYQDIMLVFHSTCQYDPTNNNDNIGDTVLLSVSFLPGCTDVEILDPDPNWVVNTDNQEDGQTSMDVLISDYNYNYYSLDNIKLQYKTSTSSDWVNVETFHKEAEGTEQAIPDDQSFINQSWDLTDLPDGDYDLRAVTDCNLAGEQTDIYSGHVDRVRPHNFGSPSPADGILDPNDELQINFNENINEALLGYSNFSISGVLNGSEIRHDASLYFDGTDIMSIPTGMNLQSKSFTVEMWVNHQAAATQTLFSQGYEDGNQIRIELTDDNQIALTLSGETVISSSIVEPNTWKHIAVIYNQDLGQVDFLIDGDLQTTEDGGQTLLADYRGEGPLTVGENFVGNLHELRVWKAQKNAGDIYAQMLKSQSGKEANLLGLWPMDELEGNPQDKARSRHGVTTAEWQVSPGGMAYSFDASNQQYLSASISDLSFREDQDFTIELWFKADGADQTILSNGTVIASPTNPEVLYGNYEGWTIRTNDNNQIEVLSNLQTLTSISTYADNNWHHLALVRNAKSNTTLYVDGTEQATRVSQDFKGFGGVELVIGATPESNSQSTTYTNYLNGSVDDIRLWNKARKQSQLTRDARAKLSGDEKGLVAYYPFETYTLNEFSQYETSSTTTDQHTDTEVYASHNLEGTGTYNENDRPLIRMARQVESVNFSYSSNGDRVILTIEDELSRVEGCILDIEVEGINDLYNNSMSSPITWTAYINQNQLIWDEQEIQREKLLGEELTFTTSIINQGGTIETYEISNLPDWLTAIPSEGILEPNSYEQITFVVHDNLFIGDYTEDIILTGNNNYGERLEFSLDVSVPQPEFDINPNAFLYTMNFVGMVTVDEIRSRDDKDILLAYVGEELRGISELIYIEEYDAYFTFMSVFSNQVTENGLEFRLWDASIGAMHSNVLVDTQSSISFNDGLIVGSFESPTHFEATTILRQEIPLNEGWNWVSFNLDAEDGASEHSVLIPTVVDELAVEQIEMLKSQIAFTQYADVEGIDGNWFGSLVELSLGDMYMLKIAQQDTIVYEGEAVQVEEVPINIHDSWNWIGYLGQRSLGINEALSSLSFSAGDVLKSKTAFSMYANESLGWLGTLNAMSPGEGYMLNSSGEGVLVYPESSMYGASNFRLDDNQYATSKWHVESDKYENSMSIVAQIENADLLNEALQNVLGVFNQNMECVGNITATPFDEQNYLYFLTVHGVKDDLLQFKYYDVKNDKTYFADYNLSFESDVIIGSINNPYVIQFEESEFEEEHNLKWYAHPNPFVNLLNVSYTLESESEVSIKVYDMLGRLMYATGEEKREIGVQQIEIPSLFWEKGAYLIEFKVKDKVFRKRIVKS